MQKRAKFRCDSLRQSSVPRQRRAEGLGSAGETAAIRDLRVDAG